ncbi:MAG: 4-alpha-glucanotransferase [[Clostridium] scindens]
MKECGAATSEQILPLNPLGYGNSPYQPYSSFAGDEIYLDLDAMMEEGLLNRKPAPFRREEARVDYEKVRAYKRKYLWEAFQNFSPNSEYEIFKTQEWVYPYAVFLTLKRQNGMKCWNEWKEEHKNWIKDQAFDISIYEAEICFEMFVQYEFYRQWKALKHYANVNKIEIMGDIPFYVGLDSLDVWMNQDEFLLGADGKPTYIAGVPPDYFSKDGQRWGNPIYDWERMKENGFVPLEKAVWLYTQDCSILSASTISVAFDTYWKFPRVFPYQGEKENGSRAAGLLLGLDVLLKRIIPEGSRLSQKTWRDMQSTGI